VKKWETETFKDVEARARHTGYAQSPRGAMPKETRKGGWAGRLTGQQVTMRRSVGGLISLKIIVGRAK